MTPSLHQSGRLALALLLGSSIPSYAQNPLLPPFDRNVIVLDPAHGGQDRGTSLNGTFEKDLTLALAANLRASLAARGLTVVTTRDADLAVTTDQRAAAANHLRPAACIVLHATSLGSGVHIATSALAPPETFYDPAAPVPWETAQTQYIAQSLRLANALGLALIQARLPVLLTRTALRPLDNLTCPAVAIEVSPLQPTGGRVTAAADTAYQHRLAETLAATILTWRNRTIAVTPAGGSR